MAAQGGWFHDESFSCATSATLATSMFYIVGLSTGTTINGRLPIILCVSSTNGQAAPFGILQDSPAVGQSAAVRLAGISKVVASTTGACTPGAYITCSTGGTAMVADSTGQLVIGRVIEGYASAQVAGATVVARMFGPFNWNA